MFEQPICKNCSWYYRSFMSYLRKDHVNNDECHHPESSWSIVEKDKIRGKHINTRKFNSCAWMRGAEHKCGAEGKLFVDKDPGYC